MRKYSGIIEGIGPLLVLIAMGVNVKNEHSPWIVALFILGFCFVGIGGYYRWLDPERED